METNAPSLSPEFQETLRRIVEDYHEALRERDQAKDWRARQNLKRKAAKRKIFPGFPCTTPFLNNEEARAYLAQEKLTCLLCGQSFRLLPAHLIFVHRVQPDDYRAAYNIPFTLGLASEGTREKKSANLKERLIDPAFQATWFGDKALRSRQASHKSKEQRTLPFRKVLSQKHLEKAGVVIGRWQDADYLHLLELMKTNDALLVDIAGKIKGTPSLASARKWFYSNPERHQLLVQTVHELSFRNQARGHMIGPRLIEEFHKLRQQGMLQREIAKATGVCIITVAKFLNEYRNRSSWAESNHAEA